MVTTVRKKLVDSPVIGESRFGGRLSKVEPGLQEQKILSLKDNWESFFREAFPLSGSDFELWFHAGQGEVEKPNCAGVDYGHLLKLTKDRLIEQKITNDSDEANRLAGIAVTKGGFALVKELERIKLIELAAV